MIDLKKLRYQAEDDLKRGREWSTTSRDVLMLLDHIAQLEEKLKNKEAAPDGFGSAQRGEPVYGITRHTHQRLELHPNDVIRLAGEVGLNVFRGDGWPDEQLIAKLGKFAAHAKQGGV